jgi:hypothetical protein
MLTVAPRTSNAAKAAAVREQGAVLVGELLQAIGRRRRPGLDGFAGEIALDVPGEAVGGLVAARAVLFEGAHDDPVQFAAQQPGQPVRFDPAPLPGLAQSLGGLREAGARAGRLVLADLPQHFEQRRFAQLRGADGRDAGQQLVEQRPERVDVAAGVDVLRGRRGLLGAHVLQGADDQPELGQHGLFGQLVPGRLGDAEVDDLRNRPAVVGCHQHVGRLDVAMDDALLVGVLDGLADGDEQLQAFADCEPVGVAILRDGQALDQFHDEIGASGVRGAGVEDLGDVGVVHQRQRLALRPEAGDHLLGVHALLDDLERHLAADGLALFGEIDDAHAAVAQDADQLVGPDPRTGAVARGGAPGGANGGDGYAVGSGVRSERGVVVHGVSAVCLMAICGDRSKFSPSPAS